MKKKTLLVAVLFFCFFATSHCLAQKETNTQSLTPEETKQIQESAQGLRQVFGIEQPPQTPAPTQTPVKKEVTLAEVADKTVDLVQRMVTNVASVLQKVAPDVWRILIKQQYAKAAGNLIPPWLLLIAIFIFRAFFKRWKPNETVEGEMGLYDAMVYIIPTMAGIIFTTWGVIALSKSIKYLINPEFYAVRDLLTMILNKGQTM